MPLQPMAQVTNAAGKIANTGFSIVVKLFFIFLNKNFFILQCFILFFERLCVHRITID